jgi:hypothetical protein
MVIVTNDNVNSQVCHVNSNESPQLVNRVVPISIASVYQSRVNIDHLKFEFIIATQKKKSKTLLKYAVIN